MHVCKNIEVTKLLGQTGLDIITELAQSDQNCLESEFFSGDTSKDNHSPGLM